MRDPWGSMQKFVQDFKELASDPQQYVVGKMHVPKEIAGNPNSVIQYMMNNGQITQDQYNAARQAAARIQNNPLFQQFMK